MAGLQDFSLPVAKQGSKPYGLHIIGNSFDEATIYQLAAFIERRYQR